jgi:hypothetical protein
MYSRLFLDGKGLMPSEQETKRLKKIRSIILVLGTLVAVSVLVLMSAVSRTPAGSEASKPDADRRGDPGLLFEVSETPVDPASSKSHGEQPSTGGASTGQSPQSALSPAPAGAGAAQSSSSSSSGPAPAGEAAKTQPDVAPAPPKGAAEAGQ